MKKKQLPPRVATGEPENLKHSPFAGLTAQLPERPAEPASAVGGEPALARERESPAKSRGRLVLRRETKHRGGKAVVIISGFAAVAGMGPRAVETLAKECKQTLGCGGTVDGDEIVLQGDRPAEVAELLRGKGFRVAGVVS